MRCLDYLTIVSGILILTGLACDEFTDSGDPLVEQKLWEEWLEKDIASAEEGDGPYYEVADTLINLYEDNSFQLSVISDFAVKDSLIAISDNMSCQLHLFNFDGERVWTVGGPGEGPGCFSAMGGIDMNAGVIAVTNMNLGRVDLFSIDNGDYLESLSVQWPFDVVVRDDSSVAVVSISESNLVTLFEPSGEITRFGSWDPIEESGMPLCPSAANINMRIDSYSNMLVVASVYYNNFQIYDVNEMTLEYQFARMPQLPLEMSSASRFILRINDCIFDCDGNILVLNAPTRPEWVNGRYSDLPFDSIQYQGIDKFKYTGEYIAGIGIEAQWDTSNLVSIDSDIYIASPTAIVRYKRVNG